jgi:signal transduction histidine kinase/CheY-like chemotaxis protein
MAAPFSHGAIGSVVWLCLLVVDLSLAARTAAAQRSDGLEPASTRHVLFLNSYQPGYQWSDDEVDGVRSVMDNQPYPVELWVEYMDSRRFGARADEDRFENYVRDKYRGHRFDLIISSDDAALTFLLERRDRLFPGVPVVFMGLNNRDLAARVDRRSYTGLLEIFHTDTLVDLALAMRPQTKRIVVIGDAAPTATAQLATVRMVAARRPDLHFVIHDGAHETLEQILDALHDTTPDDAILTTSFTRDRTGRYFPPHEAILRLISRARGPVFSESVCYVRQGILACAENVGVRHGARGAEMAAAVLAGTPPDKIAIESADGARIVVDYREVERWGIDKRRLPADALIIHAPSSFYEANKYLIWGGVSFMVLQAFVIGTLIVNIVRRQWVERELATRSEQLAVSNTDLQRLNESLRNEMTERQHAEERLRQAQKMEAIGRLAGGVAHDFNNLLTVIAGCTQCLVDLIGPAQPARGFADEVQRAGERAAALTKQLLAFGRKQVFLPVTVSLNDVIRGLEPMLRRLLGEDLALELSLTSESTAMIVDATQIEQVIMNLAINARDAMPRGGRLTIETHVTSWDQVPESERPESSAAEEHVVSLAVSDTGHGMDVDTQTHIFEPFFTTKGGKGTGLGLATVYGIVKQSGGSIGVRSDPGRGTTFTIYLPGTESAEAEVREEAVPEAMSAMSTMSTMDAMDATDATDAMDPRHAMEAVTVRAKAVGDEHHRPRLVSPRRQRETLLLVEDESAVRALAAHLLRHEGYTVIEASSGEQAMTKAAGYADRIDLLVTDVVMPGMSGHELATRLMAIRPGLKVLFMSGYTDNIMAQHGVLEPGTLLIEKPFTLGALGDKVRTVLDG